MVMRKYGYSNSYERLKKLTRGEQISKQDISNLITSLDLPEEEKTRLKELTPLNYIGIADQKKFIEC